MCRTSNTIWNKSKQWFTCSKATLRPSNTSPCGCFLKYRLWNAIDFSSSHSSQLSIICPQSMYSRIFVRHLFVAIKICVFVICFIYISKGFCVVRLGHSNFFSFRYKEHSHLDDNVNIFRADPADTDHLFKIQRAVYKSMPSLWILYLYAHITLDECHAWFHLYGLRRAMRNGKKAKNFIMKICLQWESNERPIASQAGSLDRSATHWMMIHCVLKSDLSIQIICHEMIKNTFSLKLILF